MHAMRLKQYQVDAFTSRAFKGNQAAVAPLSIWLENKIFQSIAEENNLSETAFFVPIDGWYELWWFTPALEVDLCGHATLAAAHFSISHLNHPGTSISFFTKSGEIMVSSLLKKSFQQAVQRLPVNFP